MGCRPRICISLIGSAVYWRNGAVPDPARRQQIVTELVFFADGFGSANGELIYEAIVQVCGDWRPGPLTWTAAASPGTVTPQP